jgi:hypothetical protein
MRSYTLRDIPEGELRAKVAKNCPDRPGSADLIRENRDKPVKLVLGPGII